MAIIKDPFLKVTITDHYTPRAITEDGKMYSIHRSAFMKNSGPTKVRRYLRAGMKMDAEIIIDWRDAPRGEYYGSIRFIDKK